MEYGPTGTNICFPNLRVAGGKNKILFIANTFLETKTIEREISEKMKEHRKQKTLPNMYFRKLELTWRNVAVGTGHGIRGPSKIPIIDELGKPKISNIGLKI